MWSSPLLLLVLVFSLSQKPASSLTHETKAHQAAFSPVTRTAPLTPPAVTTTTRALIPSPARILKNVTTTTVSYVASANANVDASGPLSGALSSSQPSDTVPLEGPGQWTLTSTGTLGALLLCQTSAQSVSNDVNIATKESCQLVLSSPNAVGTVPWQLQPVG